MRTALKIAEQMQTLTDEQLAEVEDFIEFLRFRALDHEITRAAAGVSEPAFQKIWSNPEDDAYDAM